jgi:hypothetical protein
MSNRFCLAAEELLAELESTRLEVALVPQRIRTNEGGMIRVAISKNATWYRRFCAQYLSARKRCNAAPDTLIKRALTVRALTQMAAGKWPETTYVARLAPIVEARAGKLLTRLSA